jgi:hypothetical protein
MSTQHIGPEEAAALFLAHIEARGASARLDDEGYVKVDLNGISGLTEDKAAALARGVIALADQLRAILKARRVIH